MPKSLRPNWACRIIWHPGRGLQARKENFHEKFSRKEGRGGTEEGERADSLFLFLLVGIGLLIKKIDHIVWD